MATTRAELEFRVLGEFTATYAGARPALGSRQQRAVLLALVLEPGRGVSADRLVGRLWTQTPPPGAFPTVHSYISRLRRVLSAAGGTALVRTPSGYTLRITLDQVDGFVFEQLAGRGRSELARGDFTQADRTLTQALTLWRGSCLPEFTDHAVAQAAIDRFQGLRLLALEDAMDAALSLGRHAASVGQLEQLVVENPLRERIWAQLVLALYRCDRQADALKALRTVRHLLAEQLGVDPGPALRRLEGQVLAQDAALDPPRLPVGGVAAASLLAGSQVRPATPQREPPPFVGRETERAALTAALDAAADGHGRVVVVSGEAGIGKTALARHMVSVAAAQGALTLWAHCSNGEGAPALWPWIQVVRSAHDQVGIPSDPVLAPLTRLVTQDLPATVEASVGRFALGRAVIDLFARISRERTVLLVVDDVHWADQASLDLVQDLATATDRQRLVLLITHRGGSEAVPLTDTLAALARQASTTRLDLTGLGESAVRDLLPAAEGDTEMVARALWHRTEGNPFFLGELIRATQWRQVASVTTASVPAGIRDVLRARLFTLPRNTFELLATAAVLGRDFPLSVLADATGTTRLECATTLEPALAADVLTPMGEGITTLRFTHSLVRETVLADLSAVRTARLHARCAQALMARQRQSPDSAEPIAHHILASSGLVPTADAIPAMLLAADITVSRAAHEAGDRLLAAATKLLRADPVTTRAEALELAVVMRRVRLRLLTRGFGVADLASLARRAYDLSPHAGTVAELCETLAMAAITAVADADHASAAALVRQGLGLAARTGDPRTIHTAHQAAARVAFNVGRVNEARVELATCVEIARGILVTTPSVSDTETVAPLHFSLGLAAFTESIAGDAVAAAALIRECFALTGRLEDPVARQLASYFGGWIAAWAGDFEECRRLIADSDAAAPDRQSPYFRHAAKVLDAWATAKQGDPASARPAIEDAVAAMVETKTLPWVAYAIALQAEVLLLCGEVAPAAAASAEALRRVAPAGEPYLPDILRIRRRGARRRPRHGRQRRGGGAGGDPAGQDPGRRRVPARPDRGPRSSRRRQGTRGTVDGMTNTLPTHTPQSRNAVVTMTSFAPFAVGLAFTLGALLGSAVLVSWITGGRRSAARYLSRLLPWRFGGRRWALVVLAMPALTIAVAAASGTFELPAGGWTGLVLALGFQTFIVGALGVNLAEEAAWGGLVQQRFTERHGLLGGALLTAPFFRYVIGETLQATGGSLLAVGVLHASFNASSSLGAGGWQYLVALLLLAVGIGAGRRIGRVGRT